MNFENGQMNPLDAIADRLGALYQAFGRIETHANDAANYAAALDELVMITAALEDAAGRKKRERNDRRNASRATSASQQK